MSKRSIHCEKDSGSFVMFTTVLECLMFYSAACIGLSVDVSMYRGNLCALGICWYFKFYIFVLTMCNTVALLAILC